MRLKYFLIILSLIQALNSFSQKPEVIPPSPNVASFAKYGDIPVNLSTGQVGLQIPIYTIQEKGLTWPLYLSYSYTGYRPSEEASWVGRGWAFSTGTVSRTIRGLRDEALNDGYLSTYSIVKSIVDLHQNNASNQAFLKTVASGAKDAEPDLFSFSFGSYSGKFSFGSDGLIHISSNLPLKITYEIATQPLDATYSAIGRSIIKWIFTVENGTQYIFSDAEYGWSESPQGAYNIKNSKSITSWHISKVIDITGNAVNFSYTTPSDTYKRVQCSYTQRKILPVPACVSSLDYDGIQFNYSAERYLSSIESSTVKISFNSILQSKPLNGSTSYFRKLKAIQITSNIGTSIPIKNFSFDYDSEGLDLLTTFQESGANPYIFSYESLNKLGTTRAVDYWGYYNGPEQNSLITYGEIVSNREPSYYHTLMGSLNKVQYPTGGSSSFEYELNTASYKQAAVSPRTRTLYRGKVFEWTYNGQSLNVNSSNNFSLSVATNCKITYSLRDKNGNNLSMYQSCQGLPNSDVLSAGNYTAENFMNKHCQLAPFNTGDVLTATVTLITTVTDLISNVGGLRIKKITDYVGDTTVAKVKEYKYNRFDSNNLSSGAVADWPDNHYVTTLSSDCYAAYQVDVWKSEPINSMAVTPILYSNVEERTGDRVNYYTFLSYENGYPDYYGYTLFDSSDDPIRESTAGPTESYEFARGFNTSTVTKNTAGTTLFKTTYTYPTDKNIATLYRAPGIYIENITGSGGNEFTIDGFNSKAYKVPLGYMPKTKEVSEDYGANP
ncbi:hypothetical protein BWI96_02105 [Siphonobacter sp. SORGH_AS_0500]|uniref:hypothetical protein n=1 Tax=Siphonobacter sp. SORGH_AS_0500 TaxID=1864824 RepID=UPI000CA8B35A|nr:hypothetical protein [Siphonobacter sp. SORGH_AS_0500]PKK37909.1 hypothetical protein BWI96_02105 [Siphonobacter sp. SORGH_AS_0500]